MIKWLNKKVIGRLISNEKLLVAALIFYALEEMVLLLCWGTPSLYRAVGKPDIVISFNIFAFCKDKTDLKQING